MPYAIVSGCPKCGAPVFVYISPDPEHAEDEPTIIYNCQCYKEERRKEER